MEKSLAFILEFCLTLRLLKHYPFVIVDALYLKAREDARVHSKGLLIAQGIREDGHFGKFLVSRSLTVNPKPAGVSFSSLKRRGLENVDLVVSDNHIGLVKAVGKCFQNTSWQRCQTHFSRNVLDKTPKRLQWKLKELLKVMYDSPYLASARAMRNRIITEFEGKHQRQWLFLKQVLMMLWRS